MLGEDLKYENILIAHLFLLIFQITGPLFWYLQTNANTKEEKSICTIDRYKFETLNILLAKVIGQ